MNENHCPVTALTKAFDPFDLTDPFPLLQQLQDETPIFYNEDIDYWVVTRYEDIKAIFRDHETFTAANTITPITPFSEEVQQMLKAGNYTPVPVLSNNVPPDHTRIRKQVNQLFLPRRMRQFAPAIREIIRKRILSFFDKKQVDLVAALTYEYPAEVLFHVLGVPAKDVPQVKAWSDNRIELYYGRSTPQEQIERTKGLVPFWHYTVDLVHNKIAHPTDDLTSDLIRLRNGDDNVLTINEIASCMITLLVAGHETTTAQSTNAILHLLSHPQKWQQLCDDPKLIPNAIEEMMRFDPSVCAWRRYVAHDTTINGISIPKGANLLLMLNAANRDKLIFDQPNEIELSRKNVKDHLAFGYGIHYCVGAPLARLEMIILLEELTTLMPSIRLLDTQTLNYMPNISFRGPLELMVAWDEE